MSPVYLDHAATTPLDSRVFEAMAPFFSEAFGNPSSPHASGRKARYALEEARSKIASCLRCESSEIILTSGGTESDTLALRCITSVARKNLVTSATEHKAILATARRLADRGRQVIILDPDEDGAVSPTLLERSLPDSVGLVSLMHVNNELGTITKIDRIAEIAHKHGALVHTDAVQAVGLLPISLEELDVDLLSLSGHKIYGPKGTGALIVRRGADVEPIILGGPQEGQRRAGTENVPGIVGLAKALELATVEKDERRERISSLRDSLASQLADSFGDRVVFNTPINDKTQCAPHILNVSFAKGDYDVFDGDMLLAHLNRHNVMVSSGSACNSGSPEPSHVLKAIGLNRETAVATVRFSLGKDTQEREIGYAVSCLRKVLHSDKTVFPIGNQPMLAAGAVERDVDRI